MFVSVVVCEDIAAAPLDSMQGEEVWVKLS